VFFKDNGLMFEVCFLMRVTF